MQKINILIVVALIVILAGAIFYFVGSRSSELPEGNIDEVNIEKENFDDVCGAMPEESSVKFECYMNTAIQLGQPELCKKITTQMEYVIGKNVLIISEDRCYWSYSLAYQDTKICNRISDVVVKESCERGATPAPIL